MAGTRQRNIQQPLLTFQNLVALTIVSCSIHYYSPWVICRTHIRHKNEGETQPFRCVGSDYMNVFAFHVNRVGSQAAVTLSVSNMKRT